MISAATGAPDSDSTLRAPSDPLAPTGAAEATTARRPRLWGLDAAALHDAYWRGLGVAVVRRGSGVEPDHAADLHLLVEPGQLVLFEVDALVERIAWRGAALTRLRVVGLEGDEYGEHVEVDADGRVTGVLRRYKPRTQASWRVVVVRRRRLAAAWAGAARRRDGWRALRVAARHEVDSLRVQGVCCGEGDAPAEHRLMDALVRTWRDPDRVIEGLVRANDLGGNDEVFMAPGQAERQDGARNGEHRDDRTGDRASAMVGPAWIGLRLPTAAPLVAIGPTWLPDDFDEAQSAALPSGVTVRAIADIEPEGKFRKVPEPKSERPFYEAAKRVFDLASCLVGMIVLMPVFLGLCVAVILDDGWPVLYGQRRQGRGGREFKCWKFRTMVRNADAIKPELANLSTGPQFFMRNDPRVTRVGAFMRKTHLDELPQLINVITGDMSLVGPRPSPDRENRINPAWREIRLSVRPGVTGLWQVRRTRRPDLDFQEWIRYDTEYVERRSFRLDLAILRDTFLAITTGRSAKLDLPNDPETDPDPQNDAN